MGLTEICKTSKWNPPFPFEDNDLRKSNNKRTRDSNPDDCDDNAIEHGMLSELHSDYKENIQLRSWKRGEIGLTEICKSSKWNPPFPFEDNDLRKSNNKRTRDSNPDDCDDNAIEHGMLSELHSDYKEDIQLRRWKSAKGKDEIKWAPESELITV
ncbi:hypothetical protein CDAR_10411 [Caerostris darwini]|uniref:Chromo domain-containing protein n=1 Tax=Caerostris darwini TaxID=1538125 RepID=A0AAV4RWC8_9ARAC|nr:hypothetical protein CDAR_10411 [Caerostris darwini]